MRGKVAISIIIMLALSQPIAMHAAEKDVPVAYRALYREVENHLTLAEDALKSAAHAPAATTFAVELLVVNGQRGPVLLSDRVRIGTMITLDRVKDLGVTGVTISIPYPLLSAKFDRYQEYRAFYRDVITMAKKRGFKVLVEIDSVFPQPEFSPLGYNYGKENLHTIEAGLLEMGKVIIGFAPDYVSLPSEPDTFCRNVGISMSDRQWAAMIERIAGVLANSGTKIGAGGGTWSPMSLFEQLAVISGLDYLDLHVYPIQRDFFVPKVSRITALASKRKKEVVVGEAWLYKIAGSELGTLIDGSPAAFARDAYSFWEPLDVRFVKSLVALCYAREIAYCSLFWMMNFYAYSDYSSVAGEAPGVVFQDINGRAAANIVKGVPNHLGEVLREAIQKEGR